MIDPKMLELSVYEHIPHLLVPVVTNPKKASAALANMVKEMEDRYRLLHDKGVRNVDSYNRLVAQAAEADGRARRSRRGRRGGRRGADEDGGEPATRNGARRGGLRAPPPAAHRRHHRRARRPDAHGRPRDRGVDHAPGAEGARRRHPSDPRHAAAVGRRHHRAHQGELPGPHLVPGDVGHQLAHHPRLRRRRAPARRGRHALPAARARRASSRLHGAFVSDQDVHRVVDFIKRQEQPRYEMALLEGERRGRGRGRRRRGLLRRALRPGRAPR